MHGCTGVIARQTTNGASTSTFYRHFATQQMYAWVSPLTQSVLCKAGSKRIYANVIFSSLIWLWNSWWFLFHNKTTVPDTFPAWWFHSWFRQSNDPGFQGWSIAEFLQQLLCLIRRRASYKCCSACPWFVWECGGESCSKW